MLVAAVWCLLLVAARGEEQLMELGEFGLDSELRFKRFPQVSLLQRILTHCEPARERTHDSIIEIIWLGKSLVYLPPSNHCSHAPRIKPGTYRVVERTCTTYSI